MNRRSILTGAALTATALLCFGCGNHPSPAPPAPVQTGSAPTPSVPAPARPAAPFAPYTLISKPASKPQVVVRKHNVLRVVRQGKTVYLADRNGQSYLAGRDQQGNLYPVYDSPETHQQYRLYYDPDRDRYYREAQADDGQYYRNYVGDPNGDYYEAGNPQSNPEYEPQIVDSDGSDYYDNADNGYGNGGYYAADAPPHHRNNHRDDWLWAIPVVIGAYFVLNQHHHHDSPPNRPSPAIATNYPGYQGSGYQGAAPGSYTPYPGASSGRPAFSPGIGRPAFTPGTPGARQPSSIAAAARQPFRPTPGTRQIVFAKPGRPGAAQYPTPSIRPHLTATAVAPTHAGHITQPYPLRSAAGARRTQTVATRRSPVRTIRVTPAFRPAARPVAHLQPTRPVAPVVMTRRAIPVKPPIPVRRPSVAVARPGFSPRKAAVSLRESAPRRAEPAAARTVRVAPAIRQPVAHPMSRPAPAPAQARSTPAPQKARPPSTPPKPK